MITAINHTHILVVVLFLILFALKAGLLFFNRHDTLNRVRSSTKMLDVVFGVLMVVTGSYLAMKYNGPIPTWVTVKVVLVLAAIPLSIIGIKQHNKILTAVGLLMFLYVYGVAETKSLKMRPDKGEAVTISNGEVKTATQDSATASHPIFIELEGTQLENAKAIYTQLCTSCHGADGTGGAVNLQRSTLDQAGRRAVIARGRGLMPGFDSQLSEQEIEILALYSTLLKK